MALRDWFPGCEPDNGLTSKQEREAEREYDATVKALRAQGPGGKRAAQEFINAEHTKYVAWRREAKAKEQRR